MKEIKIYKTLSGKEPYLDWYLSLDNSQKIIISKRLIRAKNDNYGDYKDLGKGLKEFRFKTGIRIYFTETENIIVILLNGGGKKQQSKDINKAEKYLNEYIERNK